MEAWLVPDPNDSSSIRGGAYGAPEDRGFGRDSTIKVQVGFILSFVVAALGFHAWLDDRLDRLDRSIERIEDRSSDRWPYSYMELWVANFKAANAANPVVVPELPKRAASVRRGHSD